MTNLEARRLVVTDDVGNIYVAVRDEDHPGSYVYIPTGREIARIPTGDILPTVAEFGTGVRHRRSAPAFGTGAGRLVSPPPLPPGRALPLHHAEWVGGRLPR